jgi:hypothetical protein
MRQNLTTPYPRLFLGSLVATTAFLATILSGIGGPARRAWAGAEFPRWVLAPGDTVGADVLIRPENLARMLADSTAQKPALLQIGYKFQFQSAHIPGSRYVGPASKPWGLAALKTALDSIPRREAVVLYCACCPWSDCPNVRPALLVARETGRKNVRILYIVKDLKHDWMSKGLPVGKGDD